MEYAVPRLLTHGPGSKGPLRLRPLGQISRDDTRAECEHVRVVRINRDVDPVMVGRTERLDPREIFEGRGGRFASLAPRTQGFIDPEKVAVAVDEHDGPPERHGLLLELRADIGKATHGLRWVRWEWREFR